jgi:hypothetical protein
MPKIGQPELGHRSMVKKPADSLFFHRFRCSRAKTIENCQKNKEISPDPERAQRFVKPPV